MRWLIVGSLLAACGGKDHGALLVLDAPEGATAERIEIILASADPATIEDVPNQRLDPADLAQESVRYYRQRAITGEIDDVGALDGFTLRLEPNIDVPEGVLIPLLIAYDAQDRIAAIGGVMAGGMPQPVEITDEQLLRFDVGMTIAAQTDGAGGVQTNEAMVVDCDGFRSGIAWRPETLQLRLLLPDLSLDPEATDASDRKPDMDCDGHKAIADDCDDLRGEFHAGAVELCDGFDHDCDFRAQELVPCDTPTSCGLATGVGICSDRPDTANTTVACSAEPECACQGGNCAACVIPFAGADGSPTITTCTPAIAHDVVLADCEGNCNVEVLVRPGDPFRVLIAPPGSTQFTDKLTGVVSKIDLQVDAFDDNFTAAAGGDILGGIFLAITPTPNGDIGAPSQLSFAIKLAAQRDTCPAGPATMVCSQP